MTTGATVAEAHASGTAATESPTGADTTGRLGYFVDSLFRKYSGAANALTPCTRNARDPAMSSEPTISMP